MANQEGKDRSVGTDSPVRVANDNYDPHIMPAETAARQDREGDAFKTLPTEKREASAPTDDQTAADSVQTTGGYTVDQEGLINNYAIEPEMYINEPGDLRESEAAQAMDTSQTQEDLNQDREGELTIEDDKRPKGPGLI